MTITWGKTVNLVTYGARFYANGNVHIIWGFKTIRDAWSWIMKHDFLNLGESANVVQGTDDSYMLISASPGVRNNTPERAYT